MKNIKFGILGFGVLGLIGLLMADVLAGLKNDAANTVLVLAGFAVPAAMGGMGIKAPFQRWHAILSLVGFALVVVKLRIWETIKFISLLPMGFKLSMVAAIVGLVLSIIAIAKPEEQA